MTSWSSVASSSFTSCVFAPLATIDNGTPIPSTSRLRLRPFFSPIRGVGAHAFGRKWRFVHRAVDTLPIPCNGFHLVVLSQSGLPQTKKEACLLPLLKMQMYSTGAAKLAWKSLPLAAGAQHVNDGGEDLPRRHRLAAAARFAKIQAIR